MNRMTLRVAAAALGVWASACGGDESDYDTQTNPPYAVLAVSQLGGISGGVTAGSPDATANGVLGLGGVAQNIITPIIEEQQLRLAPAVVPLVGDCTCSATGCQFDGCAADDGSWTIDGAIDVAGDIYTFDVSVTQHYATEDTSTDNAMTTSGEITISPTLIEGHLSGDVDTVLTYSDEDGETRITAWFEWSLTGNQIALDAGRCPVGGSLDASVSAEAETGGRDADYSGSGTVTFGPACGDAAVAP